MRLIDLDGNTWDGTKLNTKYRPMYDANGRSEMMAVTLGWLYDAPEFDLKAHDKEIRAKAINEYAEAVVAELEEMFGVDPMYYGAEARWAVDKAIEIVRGKE